jgi:hypothetical protein
MAMALFSWVMAGLFALFVGAILALGLFSPRSGADVLGWRAGGSPEAEATGEADDAAEMLAAANALRRRRGVPERTAEEVADSLRRDGR